jgi:hypothetical protein
MSIVLTVLKILPFVLVSITSFSQEAVTSFRFPEKTIGVEAKIGYSNIYDMTHLTENQHKITVNKISGDVKLNSDLKLKSAQFSFLVTDLEAYSSLRNCHMQQALSLKYSLTGNSEDDQYPKQDKCNAEEPPQLVANKNAELYPEIKFQFIESDTEAISSVVFDQNEFFADDVKMQVTIHGISKEIKIPVSIHMQKDNEIKLQSKFLLNLNDFEVVINSFFGFKVSNLVEINIDTVLTSTPPALTNITNSDSIHLNEKSSPCISDYHQNSTKQPHQINSFNMRILKNFLKNKDVAGGWNFLNYLGDPYAEMAWKVIVGGRTFTGLSTFSLIRTHWIHTTGLANYEKLFQQVAYQHFSQYVEILESGYFPDSDQILLSYIRALELSGIGRDSTFDVIWQNSVLQKLISWQDIVDLQKERIVLDSKVCKISENSAKQLLIIPDFLLFFPESVFISIKGLF